MPDKPFFVYFAPGATHAPHHVPPEWSDKYKGQFDHGWDALREETFARQKELGRDPGRRRAHRAPRRDPRLGRHARRPEAGARPADGGLRRLPRAHRPPRRPAHRRARRPRRPRRHARLLHHRRQRRERRGHLHGHVQRAHEPQRRGRARDAGVHGVAHRRLRQARRPTTTTPSAGRTRCARRTSGRSRSRRTGAARATARSSTGPAGIEATGEVRNQFHHVIDLAPTVLDAAGLPEPTFVNGVQQKPIRGREHGATRSTTRERAGAARDAVLRDVLQPRHLPQRLDRGDPAQHPVGSVGARCRRSTTTCGSCTRDTDWTQAHDLAAEQPEKLAELQRLWLIEVGQVQRAAPRRPARRAVQLRPRRAAACSSRATRSCSFGGMGRLSENSVLNLKNKSHAVTAEIVVPDGGAERRDHRPGRRVRRVGLYLKDGAPRYCYNLFGVAAVLRRAADADRRRGRTRCAIEFAYDGGGLGKGGTSTLYRRRRARSARGGSSAPCRWCSRPTRRCDLGERHRLTRDRRLHVGDERRSPAPSTGCSSTSATTTTTTSSRPRSA